MLSTQCNLLALFHNLAKFLELVSSSNVGNRSSECRVEVSTLGKYTCRAEEGAVLDAAEARVGRQQPKGELLYFLEYNSQFCTQKC